MDTAKEMLDALKAAGWGVRQLARRLGCDPSAISYITSGQRHNLLGQPALELYKMTHPRVVSPPKAKRNS